MQEVVAIHVKETKPGIFKEVPFGTGTVQFVEIFRKLNNIGYTGMFLIEMWADNNRTLTVEEASKDIEEARKFVLGKMDEAGMQISLSI